MSNRTYDNLKFAALIIIPVVTFITTMATLFGQLDNVLAAGIVSAFDVLVGSIVTIANQVYKRENGDVQ